MPVRQAFVTRHRLPIQPGDLSHVLGFRRPAESTAILHWVLVFLSLFGVQSRCGLLPFISGKLWCVPRGQRPLCVVLLWCWPQVDPALLQAAMTQTSGW